MNNLSLTKPLLSMLAATIMCVLISACQTSKASDANQTGKTIARHYVDNASSYYRSDNHEIRISSKNGRKSYEVDGKHFSFEQLTDDQKNSLTMLENKLDNLEYSMDIDEERMEAWSEKMEAIAEKIEEEVETLEDVMDDIDFDDHSQSVKRFSAKIAKASKVMEANMRALEEKMNAMEVDMPKIDHKTISQMEEKAAEIEKLLVEIADSI